MSKEEIALNLTEIYFKMQSNIKILDLAINQEFIFIVYKKFLNKLEGGEN